ncbi:hypothetical protein KVV02_001369 [Mortierella alpina]|uniref:Uncharacterized protein n=1 Tax=Mortierella alpina TaxID=64518 RepID=A0A9P8A4F9_MORAP|nr:hypothetical protein KVV02_001369 [Mortierella alpina]
MFTIHLTPPQTCSAAPGCRKDGSSCSLQSTEPHHQSPRQPRTAHELRQSTTPSSSALSAGPSLLVSRLQSSMFFGGFGALCREIEAMHKGFSMDESHASAPAALAPVTVVAASDTALGAQAAKEGATHEAETYSPEAHQSSGSAMVIVPRLMSSQASGIATAERPLKWYRVTIEEISKGGWQKEEAEDGVEVVALPMVSTTTTRTTTTTTQSVMLPTGMVETLLRGVAAGGADARADGAAVLSANSEQVRVDALVESRGSELQQQQQHNECERQGPVEPTTQILNPTRHDATACSAATHKTVTEAATDTTADIGSAPMRVDNDASSVPVLVSKVKELSPSSWSSSTNSRRDPNLLVTANGDETVQVATQKTMAILNHSQEKEEEPERDLRPWWQRRRDAQSAPHPRSLEDKSLRCGKGSSSSDGDDDGDGDGESTDRVRRRLWPPRQDALRNGETVTQSTVIGPDGTIQSRTVMVTTTRAKRDAEMHHAETNVRSRDIQQQQQLENAAHHEPLNDFTSSQHLPTTELQPQESQKLQQGEQHRSKLRKRWAQRRHRHQAHQDLWTQNEGSDEKDERHSLWERRRQQRERLRELREAEAQQREATAAAYGFNIHPPTLDNNGGWSVRERKAGATAAAKEEDEGRVAGGRTSEPRRTWPPKGYRRRQELERDEPRHNV